MGEFVLVALGLALGIAAYWSFVTFPRQRAFQKRQKFARALEVGDEVITYGGIIGRILTIEADQGVAHVEVADGVVLRLLTDALMQPYDAEEIAAAARKALAPDTAAVGPTTTD